MILVTGGAGFVGSNFILDWFKKSGEGEFIVTLDALTYAGSRENLKVLDKNNLHLFIQGNVSDRDCVQAIFRRYRPRAVLHFAAESHVDRSIQEPEEFVKTNVQGTATLLECSRIYWQGLPKTEAATFRFLNISTDEVYGSLTSDEPAFTEASSYKPNNPYAASKAASDHMVRAWHHTYGLPVLTTNCSNNYGPFQFPEKFIPLMLTNALAGIPLPIYGDGMNTRDWLYVSDHCSAIRVVLERGRPGHVYNVGGGSEISNIEVAKTICAVLDEKSPSTARHAGGQHDRLLTYVRDRPGHDRRYATDASKIIGELGWKPDETFTSGIEKTVEWYLNHPEWLAQVQDSSYREWIALQYGTHLKALE